MYSYIQIHNPKNMTSKHSKEKIQLVNELHKPIRKNFKRRRTIIKGLDDLWQSDLGQLDQYAKYNKNYKYILVVIDCFSKFVWTKALKTKSGVEVSESFETILKEANGRKPRNLQTDQGKEYYNAHFKSMMKKHNINHYSTFSITKAAICERVIRTIKEKLFKYFTLNGSYRWIEVLPEIVHNYNNQRHSVIGMKPSKVTKSNEKSILNSTYKNLKVVDSRKFKKGHLVRISRSKHVFEKGYTPNYTTELFKIDKINITNPTTYVLKDLHDRPIRGSFYEAELQKTNQPDVYLVEKVLRKKGQKVFVKWLGFDSSHNSWIDVSNKL